MLTNYGHSVKWKKRVVSRTFISHDRETDEYVFYDCSAESPTGRRSLCYDRAALESRKEHKPKDNAMDMAATMGIELLTEEEYREFEKLGDFDTKTSSWVKTPSKIRQLGGALFCNRRFNTVFLYHNGAESYYAGRGFRGSVRASMSRESERIATITRLELVFRGGPVKLEQMDSADPPLAVCGVYRGGSH